MNDQQPAPTTQAAEEGLVYAEGRFMPASEAAQRESDRVAGEKQRLWRARQTEADPSFEDRERERKRLQRQADRDRNPGKNSEGAAQQRARRPTGGACVCGEMEAAHVAIYGVDLGYKGPTARVLLRRIIKGKCSDYHEKGL